MNIRNRPIFILAAISSDLSILRIWTFHTQVSKRFPARNMRATPEHDILSTEHRVKFYYLRPTRLKGDQIEVFKIVNGSENIDRDIFFSIKEHRRTRGHEVTNLTV